MPTITNFGDANTVGNTTFQQNLTVQGAQSTFSGNLLASVSSLSIGNVATRFGSLYAVTQNVTTVNTTSISGTTGFVGVGTSTNLGATLQVQGNVVATNSVSATNVYVTSMNTTTTNALSIFGPAGFIAVGSSTPSGTTLHITGNTYISNGLITSNIFTGNVNVAGTTNLLTLVATSNMGIGTTPSASGATLYVQGNVVFSNGLTVSNIFTNNVNVAGTTNTLTLVATSNMGIGTTPTASGPKLYVVGNVFVSNALTASNIFTTNVNVSGTSNLSSLVLSNINMTNALVVSNIFTTNVNVSGTTNTLTLVATSNMGIGTTPAAGGANLYVIGNVFVSNALTSANIFTTNVNVTGTSNLSSLVLSNINMTNALVVSNIFTTNVNISAITNTLTLVATSNIGIGTTPLGANLYVLGNVFVSNALTAANIFMTNVTVTGTSTLAALVVSNITMSNALVVSNIFTTNVNVSGTTNTLTLVARSNIGIGTTPAASGASLYVQGNVFVSNALTASNIFTTNVNVSGTSNLLTLVLSNIYASNVIEAGNIVATNMNVTGTSNLSSLVLSNINMTNALVVSNIFTTNVNVSATTNTLTLIVTSNMGIGTIPAPLGANLYIVGNAFISNALTTDNVISTNLNVSGASNLASLVLINVFMANALVVSNVFTTNVNVEGTTNTLTLVATSNIGIGTTPTATGAKLYVIGNVYASNALTASNVLTGNLNISGTSNLLTLVARTHIGIGTTPVATSPNLYVLGNVFVSNALTASNIFTTNVNVAGTSNILTLVATSNMGIGTTPTALGPKLYVVGNVFVSNALTASNIFTTNVNVSATTNTLTLVAASNIGIGTTPAAGGANLYVQGNVFISNALTVSNIITNNVNVSGTWNITTVVATSNIGIGTIPAASGANLYVVGNAYISNSLTTTNVVASRYISYDEDLTKRAPYLVPDTSNAATIQAWISATCNAASQPTKSWWATSSRPVYGNVTAGGAQSNDDYAGSVLLPDGRVLAVPFSASNVGMFNPATGVFSTIAPVGLSSTTNKFRGGVLVPDGNVVFMPYNTSNVGLFNPLTYIFSNIEVGASGGQLRFQGGVLGASGSVIMVPRDSANIGIFNPTTLAMTNVGPIHAAGGDVYAGGVLLPNGNVVMTPLGTAPNIGMFNPTTLAFTNVGPVKSSGAFASAVLAPNGNVIFIPSSGTSNIMVYDPTVVTSPLTTGLSNIQGAASFNGAVLIPSGNIICAPSNSANVGMVDPVNLTYSNCTLVYGGGGGIFDGATLIPDGRVVFMPRGSANVGVLNTMVPASREFCLSPFFNKY